ncbi:transcriptional regulator [Kamptonema sp. UHCC 0994]|uniref:helix-turn-helix domain-containing protein n=1 Tax=Kamptonema sp. UHCC 0994 TaxID=3031329 RepID=UPI0023B98436|nr:transcriptional regulator [Kamptonema sp. UHCC 0994]MDF0552326.1 transcriptional regulator [Kamptonema sp. UHCC 0994]
MIHTFDAKSYTDLLVRYQPKPIANEAENDAAIALACELEHRPVRSPEEDLFLELLITLIEKFEAENYPIPAGNSASMLQHLMDARNLDKSDLIPVLGTQTKVEEIMVNPRAMEIDEARKIADFFQVDLSLFLESRSQHI